MTIEDGQGVAAPAITNRQNDSQKNIQQTLMQYRIEYLDEFFTKLVRKSRLRQPFQKYDEIRRLGRAHFTYEEMFDYSLVTEILVAENINRIYDDATRISLVWAVRTGKRVGGKFFNAALVKALIVAIANHVADAFALNGVHRLYVIHFMERLFSLLQKHPVKEWFSIAETEATAWAKKKNLEIECVRAAAHLTLKLTASLLRL